MKTKLMYIAVVLALLVSLVPAIAPASDAGAVVPTITVGPGKDYATIQAAIDAAVPGSVIVVYDGIYNEQITINKSLTVKSNRGPSVTTINASEMEGSVVMINGSGVTFGGDGKGFNLECNLVGIGVAAENGSTISGVTVQGNVMGEAMCGIFLVAVNDSTISGGTIIDNTISDTMIGVGLFAYEPEGGTDGNISGNTVTGNIIYSSDTGIFLGAGPIGGAEIGILSGNTIEENTISDCEEGILVANTDTNSTALPGTIYGNSIEGNTIYECNSEETSGISLINYEGNMSDNDVTGNTVYNSSHHGIYLGNGPSSYYMTGNNVTGNTVYNCPDGIALYNYGYEMYLNNVNGNTVYNCSYDGIELYNDGYAMYQNNLNGNTVYNCSDGIELYNDYGVYMGDCVIENTTTWSGSPEIGNGDGIYIYGCDDISVYGNDISYNYNTGLYLDYTDDVDARLNTIHNNSEGINIYDCYDIYIYGNDIRYNIDEEPGTGIHAYNFEDVDVICNNIVGNYVGIDADYGYGGEYLYTDDNWWGDSGGPGGYDNDGDGNYSDYAYCDVYVEDYLEEEISFDISDSSVETASVPDMVSIYDIIWPTDEQDVYSLGPSYTDLIVNITGIGCLECADPEISYNLSALLLDMLPADFNDSYVATWNTTGQAFWAAWLDELSYVDMWYTVTYENGVFADFELDIEDFFFGGNMETIFDEEYLENSSAKMHELILTELRHGTFQVPVTITTDYGITINTTVPLTVVDYQLPLERGWNLRSAPVSLESGFNTWGDIKGLGDGMPDFEAALTYNASTGWSELTSDTVITPLEAYYIKLSDSDNMGFVVNHDSSDPASRQLYAGWNLVGASSNYTFGNENLPEAYPFSPMFVQDALAAAAGNESDPGWIIAETVPSHIDFIQWFYYRGYWLEKAGYETFFYQWPWAVTYDNRWGEEGCYVTPGGGYWVFMENPGSFDGFSYTPLPWGSIPMPTPTPTPTPTLTPTPSPEPEP